jgi:hypothetical protein
VGYTSPPVMQGYGDWTCLGYEGMQQNFVGKRPFRRPRRKLKKRCWIPHGWNVHNIASNEEF